MSGLGLPLPQGMSPDLQVQQPAASQQPMPVSPQPVQSGLPQPGDIVDGHQYIGPANGKRGDPNNWKPITGEAYLQHLAKSDPNYAGVVRGVVEGRNDLPSINRNNPYTRRLVGDVMAADPTFNKSTYDRRKKLLTDMTSATGTGAIINALNNGSLHAGELQRAYDVLGNDNADLEIGHRIDNWLRGRFDPNVQAQVASVEEARNRLAPEAARIYKGGEPTIPEVEREINTFDTGASRATAAGHLSQMAAGFRDRLLTVQNQWKRAYGDIRPSQPIIDPKAAASLQQLLDRYHLDDGRLDWSTLTAGAYQKPQKPATQKPQAASGSGDAEFDAIMAKYHH